MSAFTLKIIALVCMTIDHLFKIFPDFFAQIPIPPIPFGNGSISVIGLIALLGRISFPIFAYIVAESCRYSTNKRKFLFRLFLFAVLSEIPYDLAFYGHNTLSHQNVMWTFFLAASAIFIYEDIKNTLMGTIIAICFVLLSYYTRTDYSGFGVLLVFSIYVVKPKPLKLLTAFLLICVYYLYSKGMFYSICSGDTKTLINSILPFIFTEISVIILAFYNGTRGRRMKWFFYLYYPLHLLIFGGISLL